MDGAARNLPTFHQDNWGSAHPGALNIVLCDGSVRNLKYGADPVTVAQPLLRINEVHHSIALFPARHAGIQHINHQVESADDVMRSFRFLSERQVRIVFGPGRHPSSSAKFLYFEGPDGMVFEYSSGVKMIADELLYRERQLSFDPKGFCEWGAKPDVTEFLS